MRYMLDTNTCIYAIKHRPPEVLAALQALEAAGLGVPCITVAELHFGVARSASTHSLAALRQFLAPLEVADFDLTAAAACGPRRTTLETAGTPIGPLDTQIAAHALALGVTLVSDNIRQFQRAPGPALADWVTRH